METLRKIKPDETGSGAELNFRWIAQAGTTKRAILTLTTGRQLKRQIAAHLVSILVIKGMCRVESELGSVDLMPGEALDIPPFVEYHLAVQAPALLWMHRYEGSVEEQG